MITKELIDDHVVRSDPTGPSKEAEGLKEVTGNKIPHQPRKEYDREKTLARDAAAGTHASIVLGMQSVEEGTGDQIDGPN